ncbi:MAG: hypothetical protein H6737_11755 [Alphaproteobacteria bacterium]|nr:hypothetical protein [Alphaproteobacteria bacterium]
MKAPLAPNLAALVDMLAQQPLQSADDLRVRIAHHVRVVARLADRGREADVGVARGIGELLGGLLDRWDGLTDPQRHLVQAACLYFVEAGDDEEDLDPSGFDDDLAVARWVATRLSGS